MSLAAAVREIVNSSDGWQCENLAYYSLAVKSREMEPLFGERRVPSN
jgi:hypothetical protein